MIISWLVIYLSQLSHRQVSSTCLWHVDTIFNIMNVFRDVIFSSVSVCAFCRGVGRGEGEPDRDRPNRKTETPASPQRALPLPAVWESTRDTHQVLSKDLQTSSSAGSAHGQSLIQPWTDKSSAAHFLCLCFTPCLFPPSLPIRGKCSVALLNETEAVLSYLDKEVSQRKQKINLSSVAGHFLQQSSLALFALSGVKTERKA